MYSRFKSYSCCSERARILSFILSRSTQSFQTLATPSLIAMKITRKIRNAPPRDKRFLPQSNQSTSNGLIPFLFYVFQEPASTSLHPVPQLARITKTTSHHYPVSNYLVRPLERQSRMKGRHRLRVFEATWRICYRCHLNSPSIAVERLRRVQRHPIPYCELTGICRILRIPVSFGLALASLF